MHLPLSHTQIVDFSIYATYVPTILQLLMWLTKLYIAQNATSHPNQKLVQLFLNGLVQGFRIGFNNSINSLCSARKNLQGATFHPEVVDKYIEDEVALNRVYGPYPKSICPSVHISRFGVIPKSHQPNKWHLIIDLSHLQGHSVNDNIPKTLCSLSYITVDDAIWNLAPTPYW